MPISSKLLVDKANNAFNTTTLTAIVSAQNCSVLDKNLLLYKVPVVSDLPNPLLNIGRMIFVESLNKYLYSNGIEWTDNIESPSLILWTWGYNNYGQLGTNTTVSRSSPGTTSGGGTNWSVLDINDYGYNMAGIKTDGTLWTWGRNSYGQLGDGTTTSRSSPVTTTANFYNWSTVAVGQAHMAAITTDGKLWTWGYNFYGTLGDGTTTSKANPGQYAGFDTNWDKISASGYINAAIKTDGKLWTWGYNGYGVLGTGDTVSRRTPGTTAGGGTNWTYVSAGLNITAAIKTDGTLWTWGKNTSGQLGDGTTTNRSSPGTTSGGGITWKQIDCGNNITAAIKTDGTLWTWGYNGYGELGDGFAGVGKSKSSPGTTAGGGTNWMQVSEANYYSTAIKTDGTLWTWGYNLYGQLGDGTTTNRSSPVTTAGGGTTWCFICAGGDSIGAIG